jgi:hypothetical protein
MCPDDFLGGSAGDVSLKSVVVLLLGREWVKKLQDDPG